MLVKWAHGLKYCPLFMFADLARFAWQQYYRQDLVNLYDLISEIPKSRNIPGSTD